MIKQKLSRRDSNKQWCIVVAHVGHKRRLRLNRNINCDGNGNNEEWRRTCYWNLSQAAAVNTPYMFRRTSAARHHHLWFCCCSAEGLVNTGLAKITDIFFRWQNFFFRIFSITYFFFFSVGLKDKWEKSKLKITETLRNIDKKSTKFNKESMLILSFSIIPFLSPR